MKSIRELLHSDHLYYPLLPIFFGVGWGLLALFNPSLFEPNGTDSAFDITVFSTPFWLFVLLGGGIILFQLVYENERNLQKGGLLHEECAVLFWSLGYTNLLFGVVDSFLGILLFFILGAIACSIPYLRNKNRVPFRPRLFLFATLIYVLYEATTLLWSPHPARSLSYFQREVWIAVIPLLICIAPPSASIVHRFMRYALQISYLYLLSQILLYSWVCVRIDNPLWVAFSFNKGYFTLNGTSTYPGFLLSLTGFSHYTYLGFIFLAPILYFINERVLKSNGASVRGAFLLTSFAAISYSFIHQSRTLMLFYLFILLFIVAQKYLKWSYERVISLGIFVISSLLIGFFFQLFPSNVSNFFIDTHRLQLLQTAQNYLGTHLWSGYGLGSSESLLLPYFQGAEHTGHFHNQFIQSTIEGGLISGLLMLFIPISYGIVSYKQKNSSSMLLILLFSLIMTIDLVTFFSEYLIAMLLLLSIAIHNSPSERA